MKKFTWNCWNVFLKYINTHTTLLDILSYGDGIERLNPFYYFLFFKVFLNDLIIIYKSLIFLTFTQLFLMYLKSFLFLRLDCNHLRLIMWSWFNRTTRFDFISNSNYIYDHHEITNFVVINKYLNLFVFW